MCFDITFCTGSGRRSPDLKFIKNSYGVVGPPVVEPQPKCLFLSVFPLILLLRPGKEGEGPGEKFFYGMHPLFK